jgi:prepilin-type processing-associated H-X9-DG protein
VAIIALLIAILLPSLGKARDQAKVTVNLTNLRQMGQGVALYTSEWDGFFFPHEAWYNPPGSYDKVQVTGGTFEDAAKLVADGVLSLSDANKPRRAHWVDYVGEYCNNPKAFLSPMLTDVELKNFTLDFVRPFVYKRAKWGGYGYNNQFLGRAGSATVEEFRAKITRDITHPAMTIVVADAAGSRKGAAPPGGLNSNSYVVDPPLYTVNWGAKTGKYYAGVNAANSDADMAANAPGSTNWMWRAFPAPRNNGKVGIVFADGHAETLTLKQVDDSDNDGQHDNGNWNGRGMTGPNDR